MFNLQNFNPIGLEYRRFKMRIVNFNIFLFICIFCMTTSIKAEPVPSDVKKCIAFIFRSDDNQNYAIGTGFFVGYKHTDKSDISIFLVTARHVLFDEKGNKHSHLFLRMNERGTGIAKDFNIIDSDAWFFHENESAVDIAVQPISPGNADFKYISSKHFITKEIIENNQIEVGDEVFYPGLLTYHMGREKISPIVRFGKLALITDEETIDGQFYHFIDSGNIPGHSGAPVFLWASPTRLASQGAVGPRIFGLYGIVVGVIEYNKKLEVTIPRKTYHQNIPLDSRSGGITAIVPVKFLFEILNSSQIKNKIGLSHSN